MAIETAEQIRARTQASAPQEVKPLSWQHDPEYERATNLINTNLAKLGASRTTNEQRTNEDFDTTLRRAGQQNETNLSALQNKLANQGIGYSGINVQEQGRLGQNYQDTVAQLAQGKKRSMEDIAADYAEKSAGYEDMRQQAEIGKAQRQTAYEQEQAAIQAQAEAAKQLADQQRQWMADLQAKLTTMTQPAPQPTGQMVTPKATIQQAVAAIPPPAVKTPQLQAQELGIDMRHMQTLLQKAGYDPGPIDGVMGRKTQLALARWKQSINLPATADINEQIWGQLQNYQMAGMNMGGTYKTMSGQQA